MLKLLFLALLFAATPPAALAGGGGRSEAGVCPGFAEGSVVVMRDGCFTGVAHFVDSGSLTVRNDGRVPHTYTAVDGSFDTGILNSGQSAEIAGIGSGVYRVYCTLHATPTGDGMAGVLVVGAPAGAEAALAGSPEPPTTANPGAARAGSGVVIAVLGAAAGWLLANRRAGRNPTGQPATGHPGDT